MNLKQNMFSLLRAISNYKALAGVNMALLAFRIIDSERVLYNADSCNEKLQIRYANLRV